MEELHDLRWRTFLPDEVHGGHRSERDGRLKAVQSYDAWLFVHLPLKRFSGSDSKKMYLSIS